MQVVFLYYFHVILVLHSDGMEKIMSEECDLFNSVPYYRGVEYATHCCVLSTAYELSKYNASYWHQLGNPAACHNTRKI
jgi:hypothetical protein